MSAITATTPAHEVTGAPTAPPAISDSSRRVFGRTRRKPRGPRGAWAGLVIESVARTGKWKEWSATEPRLSGFAGLEEALEGWRRRDERCYQVVAALTALGSRRGGDDDEAALAAVALLEDGVLWVAATLRDMCEIDEVIATVWEEVKAAQPNLGPLAARYLLQRARRRLTRPAAGILSRIDTTSLEQRIETNSAPAVGTHSAGAGREDQDRDLLLAAPEVEDPVADLADLLTWATGVGVIAAEEVDLIVELLAAENDGLPREEAQRLVGQRRGVAMRTIRRRRDATAARLRQAVPLYLSANA